MTWCRERNDGRTRTRMAMIVALARKLLTLWRMVKTGEVLRACASNRMPQAATHSCEQDGGQEFRRCVSESEVAGAVT